MCTLLNYQIIRSLGCIFLSIGYALNTFTSDNETYWESTSDFLPINSSHGDYYGHIRLWQQMSMSLDVEFHSRATNVSENKWENIFRVGWAATSQGPEGANSRYPSLWIDNQANVFHFALSHSNDPGWGKDFTSLVLEPRSTYSVHIEWNDTWVYFSVNGTVFWNKPRNFPTKPEYIGRLMNVYIASDIYPGATAIVTANVTASNIRIDTTPPTLSPTPSTDIPTALPSTSPTATTDPPSSDPSANPTTAPSDDPTITPSDSPTTSNPTDTPTITPSDSPTTSNPTDTPTITPSDSPTTSNPTDTPTITPSDSPTTSNPTDTPTITPSDSPTTSTSTDNPTITPSDSPTTNNSTDNPATTLTDNSTTSYPTTEPTATENPLSTEATSVLLNTPSTTPNINTSSYLVAMRTTTNTVAQSTKSRAAGRISNDLIYLTVAACAGCILCSLMVVIIIKNSSKQEPPLPQHKDKPIGNAKHEGGNNSPYVEFEDKSPGVAPQAPPKKEDSPTPVVITTRGYSHDDDTQTKPSVNEGSDNVIDVDPFQGLNEAEIAEIRNGMDRNTESEYEEEEEEEEEIDEEETESDEMEEHHVEPGIDGMDPFETAPAAEAEAEDSEEPQPPHIMVKRKYLMSEQLEEEYIKRMMREVAVVDHGDSLIAPARQPMRRGYSSSHKPPPKHDYDLGVIPDDKKYNEEYKAVELVSIVDDIDVESDDDTLKNVPIIPTAPSTLLDVASSQMLGSQLMDEESITMLESGYEWITLVLLEIDPENWKQYVDNFKKHGVSEDRLVALTDEDLRELIPHIGPRNEFFRLLENKLGKYHD